MTQAAVRIPNIRHRERPIAAPAVSPTVDALRPASTLPPVATSSPAAASPPAPAEEYVVGYGRPPIASRFQPGQSGNPRGRPRGAVGVNTMVRDLLLQKVELRMDGRAQKITHAKMLLLKLLEKASRGDTRSIERLLHLYADAVREEPVAAMAAIPAADIAERSATDEAILAMFRAEVLAEREGGRE